MNAKQLINTLKNKNFTDFIFISNNELGEEVVQTFAFTEIPETLLNEQIKEFDFWMDEGSPFSKPELKLYI